MPQKILGVEDDRTLQAVLGFNILKEGYAVIQAFTG
jgi:DNA-binding response OmpR family regulator